MDHLNVLIFFISFLFFFKLFFFLQDFDFDGCFLVGVDLEEIDK